ncbi:MAG: hypothetical protein AABY95_04345 [Pseudomonadota bacterium]
MALLIVAGLIVAGAMHFGGLTSAPDLSEPAPLMQPVEKAGIVPPGLAPSKPASLPAPVPAAGTSEKQVHSPVRDALQARLDAIARAYNKGDASAADRALWENHAVVRPNGVSLSRSDLLDQWKREWTESQNRSLSYAIEQVTESDSNVTAIWSLILTSDVQDSQGEWHKYELNARQKAGYIQSGGREILEGPITFLEYEQTMDGFPWNP